VPSSIDRSEQRMWLKAGLLGLLGLAFFSLLFHVPDVLAQNRNMRVVLAQGGELPTWIIASRIGFRFMASLTAIFAIAMISRREVVTAVVCLVGSFFCLAGCYVFLTAHFLAALQILVYAGAIMVLFLFVIMLLNRGEPDLGLTRRLGTRIVGATAALVIVYRMATLLVQHAPTGLPPVGRDFGTVAAVGKLLFDEFVVPFEVTSILLLVAVVGAVVVAHRTRRREQEIRHQASKQTAHAHH
jgi:NADH-quinone oxidoreductase subunit J